MRRCFQGQDRAYLRSATTANDRVLQLDRVTSNPAQPNQATKLLGTFPLVRSGLLLGLRTIPLAGPNGASSPISLNAVQTLRWTAVEPAGSISVSYLVLVPEGGSEPAGAPLLTNPRVAAGSFLFSFQSEPNVVYAIEFRDRLAGGTTGWQRLESITGDGTLQSVTHPVACGRVLPRGRSVTFNSRSSGGRVKWMGWLSPTGELKKWVAITLAARRIGEPAGIGTEALNLPEQTEVCVRIFRGVAEYLHDDNCRERLRSGITTL